MSASDRTPVGDPDPDPVTDSASGLPRTYGRTHGDELVTTDTQVAESNARESQTDVLDSEIGKAIGPIVWGHSPRYAEVNGAKVIVARDLPPSILEALASLVDAIQREFGDVEVLRQAVEVDRPKPLCRWHPGQVAEFCGPCRSEKIARETE